jgi:hypothetical protein
MISGTEACESQDANPDTANEHSSKPIPGQMLIKSLESDEMSVQKNQCIE